MTDFAERARGAFKGPLRRVLDALPSRYKDEPSVLLSIMSAVSGSDPALIDRPAWREAHSAVLAWNEAHGLAQKVSRLYHDPRLRAEFGADRIEYFYKHPDEAYAALITAGAEGGIKDRDAAHEALEAIGHVRAFSETHGLAYDGGTPTALPSLPPTAAGQDAAYRELIQKSLRGRLTADETERLDRLAGARAAAEERGENAAVVARQAPAPAPGEYERLIKTSVTGPLSAGQQARLEQLAGQREVGAGRASAEDLVDSRVARALGTAQGIQPPSRNEQEPVE